MKVLCVSDQLDPLVYSTSIKERFKDIDVILCAGDLPLDYVDFIVSSLNKPTFFIFGNHNLKEFSLYHKNIHSTSPTALPFPNANNFNDSATHKSAGHGADYAGFKVLKVKSISITNSKTGKKTPFLIAGASGSIRYNHGMNQYTDRQMFFKLLQLVPTLILNKILYGRYVDVFLTHASPRHIHDLEDKCHQGFKCFNWFMRKFTPKYLIHGHIHLYDSRAERITQCENTTVVNAFGYTIVDMPDIL